MIWAIIIIVVIIIITITKIYMFATMVYKYNYHNSWHYPSSCLLLKQDFSETGFCLRLQVNPTELGPVSETSCFK
jgi:hypothetical protein